jgi:hypothetical protein
MLRSPVLVLRAMRVAVVLAVGALGVAACGQGPPGSTTSTPGSFFDDLCPKATAPATASPALHAAIVKVERAAGVTDETGAGALPGYVSVIQCTDTNELLVFWKGDLPKPVRDAIAEVELEVTVKTDAPYSAAELQGVEDKVWADKSYWEDQGVHLQGTNTREDGQCLEVDVDNDEEHLDSIQADLSERYPDVTIKVAYQAPLVPMLVS